MELYKEILAHALQHGEIQITFSGEEPNLAEIVEGRCYRALKKIKDILQDSTLEDAACFLKIEEIVNTLEALGSSGGSRHDFG